MARVSGKPRAPGCAVRSGVVVRCECCGCRPCCPLYPRLAQQAGCALRVAGHSGYFPGRAMEARVSSLLASSVTNGERWREGRGRRGTWVEKVELSTKLPNGLTRKSTAAREMCETRTCSMFVPSGLGWVWQVPVSRARAASRAGGFCGREERLLLGFRSGHPRFGGYQQTEPGQAGLAEGLLPLAAGCPGPGAIL
ncbi:unnamed protein product [Coccothraustes coccothraustes]